MIEPLETLFDQAGGPEIPLSPALSALYGRLAFPTPDRRPWVIGNFVSTLDGVTSLGHANLHGGGEISGHNRHDRMVMGLLRSVADAVVVGAGTLRADSNHEWTSRRVFPDLAAEFAGLRETLGLPPLPLNVFVTARGDIDFGLRVFAAADVPILIVTTDNGQQHLRRQSVPPAVRIESIGDQARLSATSILDAVDRAGSSHIVLVEGGPHLMSDFFAEGKMDELFLTLAPQVAGRDQSVERPGFVTGRLFAPDSPVWGKLVSVRRAAGHLLLRYAFT